MSDAAALMDRMYRRQRYIYDASRKFYLLGRDEMIDGVNARAGDSVLEIGCGTGRNLIKLARTYPQSQCCGLDVSQVMLDTAAPRSPAPGCNTAFAWRRATRRISTRKPCSEVRDLSASSFPTPCR